MADFIWLQQHRNTSPFRFEELYQKPLLNIDGLALYGKDGTYTHIEGQNEFVTLLGHACYPGKSLHQTLSEILKSFNESMIGDLKQKLIGQFILIIKKETSIYVFADWMQIRSVFYSQKGDVVSSSYSVVEKTLGAKGIDLDNYKVFEFMAMRHMLYPGWLGRSTMHKYIMRLRPFEYLVINTPDSTYRVGSIKYSIDNKKEYDINNLSLELLRRLRTIIEQPDFRDKKVGVSITGGHDSRLVASIAAKYYRNMHLRTSASKEDTHSMIDLKIARKISRVTNIPIDVYWKNEADHECFYMLTEGFTPSYNAAITPLINATGLYALGLGGAFGTEMFFPLPFDSITSCIDKSIAKAKAYFDVEDVMWDQFRENMEREFADINQHYEFADPREQDQVRIFCLMNTGSYGSFIMSSFNIHGAQMDPYCSFPILECAIKVPDEYSGNKYKLGGIALVQKAAMATENYEVGRVQTYRHFRPMLPLSLKTVPPYLAGYLKHVFHWAKTRTLSGGSEIKTTYFNGGRYISDGWNAPFIRRIKDCYGDYANVESS